MLNKQQLIGYLGAEPELKYTGGGSAVCELRIATTKKWTDKSGQSKEKTTWHRVVVWGKLAEVCGKYLAKGRLVYVEGETDHRSYEDKDGNKRYITEVVANEVKFLGGGKGEQGPRDEQPRSNQRHDRGSTGAHDDFGGGPDDDIPF